MHIAAADPQFVRKEDVTPSAIEKEKDIQRARVIAEGKPEKMADKIVEGRMGKFYEEVCLYEQPFVERKHANGIDQLIKTKIAKLGREHRRSTRVYPLQSRRRGNAQSRKPMSRKDARPQRKSVFLCALAFFARQFLLFQQGRELPDNPPQNTPESCSAKRRSPGGRRALRHRRGARKIPGGRSRAEVAKQASRWV